MEGKMEARKHPKKGPPGTDTFLRLSCNSRVFDFLMPLQSTLNSPISQIMICYSVACYYVLPNSQVYDSMFSTKTPLFTHGGRFLPEETAQLIILVSFYMVNSKYNLLAIYIFLHHLPIFVKECLLLLDGIYCRKQFLHQIDSP